MQDDDLKENPSVIETEEIEIDSEGSQDLEAAMRDAVEAVERAEAHDDDRRSRAAGDRSAESRREQTSEDSEVAMLEAEIADLRDRSARTLADFDNYRKRIERERREDRRFANFDLVRELLSVIDNLERALASPGDANDLKVGVEMILRQMRDLLRNHGVSRVQSVGQQFDPKLHDAVSRHEDPEVEVPRVSEELQSGYLMYDRLLRPATVKVAMPAEGNETGHDESKEPIH